jgi:hypothetical protein
VALCKNVELFECHLVGGEQVLFSSVRLLGTSVHRVLVPACKAVGAGIESIFGLIASACRLVPRLFGW